MIDMTKFCSHCGKEATANVKYCDECGTPFSGTVRLAEVLPNSETSVESSDVSNVSDALGTAESPDVSELSETEIEQPSEVAQAPQSQFIPPFPPIYEQTPQQRQYQDYYGVPQATQRPTYYHSQQYQHPQYQPHQQYQPFQPYPLPPQPTESESEQPEGSSLHWISLVVSVISYFVFFQLLGGEGWLQEVNQFDYLAAIMSFLALFAGIFLIPKRRIALKITSIIISSLVLFWALSWILTHGF